MRIKVLKRLYLFMSAGVIILIILTPWLITKGFSIFDDETVEVILIALLFGLGYVIYFFYQHELEKGKKDLEDLKKQRRTLEQRMDDAFKYIGSVNVQIQEIKSIFAELKIYPENKKEFKYILDFLANKILSIVDVDWAVLRIIDLASLKTLRETSVCRGNAVMLKYHFTNDDLIKQPENLKEYSVILAEQKNLTINIFCIFSKIQISKDQEVFIKAILNQLEMFFIIFSSNYYKNSRINLNNKN